jgi:hypothetical protein
MLSGSIFAAVIASPTPSAPGLLQNANPVPTAPIPTFTFGSIFDYLVTRVRAPQNNTPPRF